MATHYGLLKLEQKKVIYTTKHKKGVLVSQIKNDINPMFFMESDEIAERVCVKISTKGMFNVDWVILDKTKRKENKKHLYFETKSELVMWLVDYFKGVDKFFVSGGPNHSDKKMYIDFLTGKDMLDVQIINL